MDPEADGVLSGADGVARCWWAGDDPLYLDYHDREWGRPVGDDRRIFEKLCLEGFQAGLSWLTILRKRDGFRCAFSAFDPEAVARFDAAAVARLLLDAGIVRHRAKIEATITNARRYLALVEELGSLAAYVWSFEPDAAGRPEPVDRGTLARLSESPEAKALSKDLKQRGWSFVGPTTVYSAMQSLGLVNDHLSTCQARVEVERERALFSRPQRPW